VGNGNIVTGNPALSVAALNTAFSILGTRTDTEGEPILVEEAILVVPPALKVTASNIMNQITVDVTEVGGTTNQVVRVNNWIVGNLQMVVDPYIPGGGQRCRRRHLLVSVRLAQRGAPGVGSRVPARLCRAAALPEASQHRARGRRGRPDRG
jgi:hypothetical protein